jgi:hypothetical protein
MNPPNRFTLRDLPLAARLTLAVFLIAVGLGYGSALVQLHFQHATPGNALPSIDDVVRKFHGETDPAKKVSTLERLIDTPSHEDTPFNGSGSMARAFTTKSSDFSREIKKRPRAEVEQERENERQALLAFVKGGLKKAEFDADAMPRPASLADKPITAEFLTADGAIKIKSLFTERCLRCHAPDGDDSQAAKFPLDKFEHMQEYAKTEANAGAMSLPALTQSTHAHLLTFAVLWAVTGLAIAFSSYPGWIRNWLAPIVLVAQVADVACWWLARLDGSLGVHFAQAIVVTGGIVGLGLALQILLGLFDLFGTTGRVVLIVLMMGAGAGAYFLKERAIEPQLQKERAPATPAKVD